MSEASLFVETTAGKVPLAQYQQWQALAESAAQQRGDRAVRKVEPGQGTALPCMICNAGPCIRTKKYFCRFPGGPHLACSCTCSCGRTNSRVSALGTPCSSSAWAPPSALPRPPGTTGTLPTPCCTHCSQRRSPRPSRQPPPPLRRSTV